MTKKIINALGALAKLALRGKGAAFCNIAEGTHAGSLTMAAGENIESQNLVVCAGSNEGEFAIAKATDKPLGICVDQGAKGERLAVLLPGSAGSTFMCRATGDVSAGDSVYTAANGKVSATAANGAYKVGIALCSAASGGVVEIDPQGFGESAWQFFAAGLFTWTGSSTSATLSCTGLTANDAIVAAIHTAGGSENCVAAKAGSSGITFTLDASGTADTTKISWIAIRKN
ncbi:MAG: DUF2190 family protein [Opitutales bacterium]|nr:DUF2190 family protein [Opitutales bacterium]